MSQSTEVIHKGDVYRNTMGHPLVADCDGLLVRQGMYVMIVPDARMAGALNQLGGWRVKERHGERQP